MSASPPPDLTFLGIDIHLYPLGQSCSGVISSYSLIQVSGKAYNAAFASVISAWMHSVLLAADLQLISNPL